MSGYASSQTRPDGVDHKITVGDDNKILRDGKLVRVLRLSNYEIQVGCTVVEVAALRQLLRMAEAKILQEGAA